MIIIRIDNYGQVASLTGSRSGQTEARQGASSCAAVVTSVTLLITLIDQNPASPKVAVVAVEVSSATVTCSDAEKASLTSVQTALTEAAATVSEALESVQADLLSKNKTIT